MSRLEQTRISVVVDPPGGWFDPFAERLRDKLQAVGHDVILVDAQREVQRGEIAFYLSCTGITPPEILARNSQNVVVHASPLPQGRGFSPLAWQVLDGCNIIPITMISMTEEVDAGDVLMRRNLEFNGHELNDEMRARLGDEIVGMCVEFVGRPTIGQPQRGEPTWYRRRRREDSRLDPVSSIESQFDLLRVVDNERYPAYFDLRGHRYYLSITRRKRPLDTTELEQ